MSVVAKFLRTLLWSVFLTHRAFAATETSPWDLAWSPDGQTLAVTDRTGNRVALIDPADTGAPQWIALQDQPCGAVWSGPAQLTVAEFGTGTLAVIDTTDGTIQKRIFCGGKPVGLAQAGNNLLIADYGLNRLLALDPDNGDVRFFTPVARHPVAVAVSPDGQLAVTGGLLPAGPATLQMASSIFLIELPTGRTLGEFKLPAGSSNLRGLAISRDGSFAFAVHTRGQIALPTTQPDRGWINNNAVSVLDLKNREWVATLLLDTPTLGAADPWGVAPLYDGRVAITASGTSDVILFDWPRVQKLLAGEETLEIGSALRQYRDPGTPGYGGTAAQLWARIAADPAERALLASDLAVTSAPGLACRVPSGAHGLRALALSPDEKTLAATAYFDSAILLIDPADGQVIRKIPLAKPQTETLARQGERLFHDATLSFQNWMSCATCHHAARTDGMNWDLLNDGIGNPKNTKSMLFAPQTEPMTWLGAREDHLLSIKKGMHFFMAEPTDGQVEAINAYFNALTPEPSPWLEHRPDGSTALTASAQRGEKLFQDLHCGVCHSGPLFTDLEKYDVGTGSDLDGQAPYDTPTLIELWRTGPYLHDGSANTLYDVLIASDPQGKHSPAATCTTNELNDLVHYLMSL